ncbi:MAG: ATP-dependent helicase, partial [Clostridiales bacterium]|nr:ATP-dependent helicase [Clostridiales bacterium]
DIKRYCNTKIKAQPIPSLGDETETRVEKIFDRLDTYIENQDMKRYVDMVESFVNEKDYTAMDVAAAFLAETLGNTDGNGKVHQNEEEFGDTGAEAGMVCVFINFGIEQG